MSMINQSPPKRNSKRPTQDDSSLCISPETKKTKVGRVVHDSPTDSEELAVTIDQPRWEL